MSDRGSSWEHILFRIYLVADALLGLAALYFLRQSIEHSSNGYLRASAQDETSLAICVIVGLVPWVVHFIVKWIVEGFRRKGP
jgi:hypothetical protein